MLGAVILASALLLSLTIVLSLYLDVRTIGFKIVPMWVILITLCMVSKGAPVSGVLTGIILCFASEYVCYLDQDTNTKLERIPPVLISDLLIIIPLGLLTATKLDNARSLRDQEYLAYRRRQDEADQLLKALRRMEEDAAAPEDSDERVTLTTIEGKRALLAAVHASYQLIFGVRTRRDVAKMLEVSMDNLLGISAGIVLETDEKSKDLRLRNHWGLPKQESVDTISLVAEHKNSELFRWAVERKMSILSEDCDREISLNDARTAFNKALFPFSCFIPIVAQQRTVFLVVLGEPRARSPVAFDPRQLQTMMACLGACLVKIEAHDARPSFSAFQKT